MYSLQKSITYLYLYVQSEHIFLTVDQNSFRKKKYQCYFFINSSMSTKFVNGPLEHERQTRDALDSDSSKLDDVVTTSKAVSWPKVRNWILDHMLKSR